MSLYRNILSQACKITWRYKYLWFFGLFAALLGNGGEYEILIRSLNGDYSQSFFPSLRRIAETGVFSSNTLSNIGQLILEDTLSMLLLIIIGLVILVLFGFLVWLVIVSQAALVNNSANIITGGKSRASDIQNGVISGMKNFWPVFGLNILIKIIIFLALVLLGLPIILTTGRADAITVNFVYLIAFLIFIPLSIALSFMIKYAIAYVVIRGSGFIESIKQGWQLFARNWIISIEMAFVLFFINLLVGLAIVLTILILAVPFLFLALVFYYLASVAGFWIVAILALIIFLAIIVLAGAALATFQTASWTGLFIELVGKGGASKIMRVMSKIMK